MKVAVIVGSLRKESINRSIARHYSELAKDLFDCTELSIGDLPLYNQDIDPMPEQVIQLANGIRQSDGVLFFSPEYNYSIPGVLKNALDWLSRVDKQPFDQKPVALIGASPGNIGTARMQYHFRQVGVFLNMKILNKPEIMIGQAYGKIEGGRISDQGTLEFLQKHAVLFKDFIGK